MHQSIVECVYDHAVNFPKKLCIVDESRKLTYKEYWNEILDLKEFLLQHGVQKGSCIVVVANQSIDYLALELAIQLCGAIFVPLERNCASKRVQDVITATNAIVVISESKEPYTCTSLTYNQIKENLDSGKNVHERIKFPELEDTAEILFSTGTTGKPKGIELTHRNDIAVAENVRRGVKMKSDNTELIPVPLNHSHGLRRYYGNMLNGSTVIILSGVLNVKKVFEFIETYKVTAIDLVPASLRILFKISGDKIGQYKEQLDYIQLGSAPLLESDKQRLCELLPQTRLYNFYGSTESGCTCILDFNEQKGLQNCIGRATYNTTFSFVDENYQPIAATPNHPGLIASSGAMNMKGYWKDPQETAKVLRNGTIYSNDLAYQDNDGFIFMVGRKNDVINVGGNKVGPEEIEGIALQYTGILDCACIGVEDTLKGSVPKLFITVKDKENFDIKKFSLYLQSQMEVYKLPKYIEVINKIPRAFNGKVLRRELY